MHLNHRKLFNQKTVRVFKLHQTKHKFPITSKPILRREITNDATQAKLLGKIDAITFVLGALINWVNPTWWSKGIHSEVLK